MTDKIEKYQFKTETKKLLDIVINSLYSNKEIFLRELISNSSDAIDKVRFLSLTDPSIMEKGEELEIHIEIDKKHNKFSIHDNGIGMSKEEVIDKIGTIAKSGSLEFLSAYEKNKNLPLELIGQFGVGFYSSFMVAERVTLITRDKNSEKGTKWSSDGDGTFTISDIEREKRGTSVILELKKKGKDEDFADFANEWTIKSIIKKHSDFISYPVTMDVEKEEMEKDDKGKETKVKKIVRETLNSREALWNRKSDSIKEEEYNEFYKHISHDWEKPIKVIHLSAEGRMEYKALLYIPSKKPFSFNYTDRNSSLSLYVKRVLIIDDCKDLLPPYLRFVKGLVDARDLSLNISREMLQRDGNVISIKNHLTKKVIDTLNELKKEDFEGFKKFFNEFGISIKEGIYADYSSKDKLKELLLYKSTKSDDFISLDEYIKRMQKDQKEIYYISGDNGDNLRHSPHLEIFNEKGFEVLFFTDPIDEFIVETLADYNGKKFVSISKGEIDLGEDKDKKDERKSKETKFDSLLKYIKNELGDSVKDVQYSRRLTDSVSCLVSDKDDLSANMERILKSTGHETPKSKRILEINPDHKLIEVLNNLFERDNTNPRLKSYCALIYEQALLTEGTPLADPAAFSKKVTEIMLEAAGESAKSRIITL